MGPFVYCLQQYRRISGTRQLSGSGGGGASISIYDGGSNLSDAATRQERS